jgi:hypothetical protein
VQIVTLLLADEEWSKIRRVAEAAWPGAVLDRQMSRAEACRRLLLAGLNRYRMRTSPRWSDRCNRVGMTLGRSCREPATDAEEPVQYDSDADLAVSVLRVCALRSRPAAAGQRAAGVLPVRAGHHAGEG